ncbi:SLC13 family permease [Neomesorhizobium albiziae]|nr:SLC13 family permease [Mesorhizobium albiziae]
MSFLAFLILVAAFTWGSATAVNAGLIAIVASYAVGSQLAGLSVSSVAAQFPAGLFFVLFGATLLFAIVRATGTIDLLAYWAERLAQGKRLRIPVIMFLLTATLSTMGAFTPAAIAIVAPIAISLGLRFGISALAMGLVVVQGANAGAFSPVNPFGVVSNAMLERAGAGDQGSLLFVYCFVFNAVVGLVAFAITQWMVSRSASLVTGPVQAETPTGSNLNTPVPFDALKALSLLAIASLLIMNLGFGIDVGVAALSASLALVAVRPSLQKVALQNVPWSAIVLVTGIVMYVGVLEEMGLIKELEAMLSQLGDNSIAVLVTAYIVGFVSAFASTTGTLGAITPVVIPLATDPMTTAIGVVTVISIASSVVDVSPMSTSGALLMASAQAKEETTFFRALLIFAACMIVVVLAIAWAVFVWLPSSGG